MNHDDILQNLLDTFIDQWNDSNPTQRLSRSLVNLIDLFLGMALTVGYERAYREVSGILDAEQKLVRADGSRRNAISINFLRDKLLK